MENNEGKKVIKISLKSFIAIAAATVVVLFVGVNLLAYKMEKPNLISGIEALINNEENTDEIAKELFEKAVLAIRDSDKFYEPAEPEEIIKIDDRYFKKTTSEYSEIKEKIGEIFAEETLEDVLKLSFYNIDGIAYAIPTAGPGYYIDNIEVEKINDKEGTITYRAKYIKNYVDGGNPKEEKCEFKIKKINEEYRIIETNYRELYANKDDNELDNETVKALFEKGAYEIRTLIYGGKEYEIARPEEKKEINGIEYIKTTEKYETVEKKYGEIFVGEALRNVLSEKFANIDGILYIENAWRSNRMGYYKCRSTKNK